MSKTNYKRLGGLYPRSGCKESGFEGNETIRCQYL